MSDQDVNLAPGRPGITPRWTSSTKDGIGTAYAASSRVWFTLSHGILNEIYFPRIDLPQMRDAEFLITDGQSFFHEEKRDLRHEMSALESDVLGYRITSHDREGRYKLVKEYICDPHQACVLIRVSLEGAPEFLATLKLYFLAAPHLDGGGEHNTGWRVQVVGRPMLAARREDYFLTVGATVPFTRTSCGYVGSSDGWTDLRENFRMDYGFERAEDGNIALTAELDISRTKKFTLCLAFGRTFHDAATSLVQSLATPFDRQVKRFIEQWRRACAPCLALEEHARDGGRLYRASRCILLAHEDKTYAGASIASLSIPWGEARGDDEQGGYHLVWVRDACQAASAYLAMGNAGTALRVLVYLACAQRPDGSFPRNFWIDGNAYGSGHQLDQAAFFILLAYRLWKQGALEDFDPCSAVRKAAGYLARIGPDTEQDRWEENSGYAVSTLAVTVAAMHCASAMACRVSYADSAQFLEDWADYVESHIEQWTVTSAGTVHPDVKRHYIRLLPVEPGHVVADEDPDTAEYYLANQLPGQNVPRRARDIVATDFLELVRYGIRRPDDPLILDTLRVTDSLLKVDTPSGPCFYRYLHDGYGELPDGSPFDGAGVGRLWPLLTGERAHYELAAGHDCGPWIEAMERFASCGQLLSEQIWDTQDIPAKGMRFGRPTGSARPLAWAHAEYIKLLRSAHDGEIFDRVDEVADRYLHGRGRKDLEVWTLRRQIPHMPAGRTLRIQADRPFSLHWSDDGWGNPHDTDSRDSGLGIYFADVTTRAGAAGTIQFTWRWMDNGQWLGHDYSVELKS